MALYKICSYCRNKYEYGKECSCDGVGKAKQRRQKHYDKYVRKSDINKKYDTFYHSLEWKRIVEYIKNRYNNMCIMCLMNEGIPVKQDVVHHILEIKSNDGWEHRLDEDMIVPLCHGCHNDVHSNYTRDEIDKLIELIKEYKEKYEV